jgi:hypothetical protein
LAEATNHFVAERFFGRSGNRLGAKNEGIFTATSCPWRDERQSGIFCCECHELLLHNPVPLPEDVALFAELVRMRNLEETVKPTDYSKIAGRVVLFHAVIETCRNPVISLRTPGEIGRDANGASWPHIAMTIDSPDAACHAAGDRL